VVKRKKKRSSRKLGTNHRGPIDKAPRAIGNYESSVEGLRILNLEAERLADHEVNAVDIDHIAIAAREVEAVRIVGLTGSLHVGGGGIKPNCYGLLLERCVVGRLALYDAVLANCSFVECQIDELLASGSIFSDCKFTGRIAKGIFAPRSASEPGAPQFENNDFSECDLGDVAFRGGIDLSRQRFNPVQTRMNIENAELLLSRIDQRISAGSSATGLADIRAFLKRSMDFNQSHIFISKEVARRYLVKYIANIDQAERKMVSSEFADWANEIERHCGSRS